MPGPDTEQSTGRVKRTVSFLGDDDKITQKWLKKREKWTLSELIRLALVSIRVLPKRKRR